MAKSKKMMPKKMMKKAKGKMKDSAKMAMMKKLEGKEV